MNVRNIVPSNYAKNMTNSNREHETLNAKTENVERYYGLVHGTETFTSMNDDDCGEESNTTTRSSSFSRQHDMRTPTRLSLIHI